MKSFVMELGNDLFRYTPAGGAMVLDMAGWLTLTNVMYLVIIIYTLIQVVITIRRWRNSVKLHDLEVRREQLIIQSIEEKIKRGEYENN